MNHLPVEVLTSEEIEKIVEEKIRKRSAEMQQLDTEIKAEITMLKAQIAELTGRVNELSASPPSKAPVQPTFEDALRSELGGLAELLEIRSQPNQVTLRPRRYLGAQDFKSVSDAIRRHGGFWSSMNRAFIIRRART